LRSLSKYDRIAASSFFKFLSYGSILLVVLTPGMTRGALLVDVAGGVCPKKLENQEPPPLDGAVFGGGGVVTAAPLDAGSCLGAVLDEGGVSETSKLNGVLVGLAAPALATGCVL
jgi:hypothetical protein